MKLSNQQIDSIVSSVIRKQRQEQEKELSAYKNNPLVLKELNKTLALVDKMPEKIKTHFKNRYYKSDFVSWLIEDFKPSVRIDSHSDLKEKIILASIDSSTLEELKNKLGIQF